MPVAAPEDLKDLVEVIRRPTSTAEQKKIAAATIGLILLRSQINAGGNLNFTFDPNNSENFGDTVTKIQDTITKL